MAQFTLTWDNDAVETNANVTQQVASYSSTIGAVSWQTGSFSPTNPLAKTASTTDTPNTLLDNIVYQFKLEAICTTGGPTPNDNGLPQAIQFACLTPTLTKTQTSLTISIDVTGLSITKARLTLKEFGTNATVLNKFEQARTGNVIVYTKTGLKSGQGYYWVVELYAVVDGVGVYSSDPAYLGGVGCTSVLVTTDAVPVCSTLTGLTVKATVIP